MKHAILRNSQRVLSAFSYVLLGALNLCVLYAALKAAHAPMQATPWSLSWLALCLLLGAAWIRPRTRFGQALGVASTYIYAVQPILLFAAIPGALLLFLFRQNSARETFAGALTVCAFACALGAGAAGIRNARTVRLTRYALRTDKALPEGKLRIVQLSDLHLGFINNRTALERTVQRTNALSPDLVCITGDTFTESVRTVRDFAGMAETLAGLQTRFGVYACLGNHDAGRDYGKMLRFFDASGVRLLVDETVDPAPGVRLIGRSDAAPQGIRNRARKAASVFPIGETEYNIILDHQPSDADAVREAGGDLLLCGHTHGGQFFPANLFIRMRFPHIKGSREQSGMCTIVNSGSGAATPPIRLGSHGEIVLIEITGNRA